MYRVINSQTKIFLFWLSLFLLGTFTGCDSMSNLTDAEHVANAKDFLDNGDVNGSIIELKNALQKNSENAEARRLLGINYLELENGAAAEKELKRALDLGVAKEAIFIPLGESLQLQGKNQEVLDDITPLDSLDAKNQARLIALRGNAWFALGKPEKAKTEFDHALEIDNNSADAKFGQARISAANNEIEQALLLIEQALTNSPEDGLIWSFQGSLYQSKGDYKKAETSFGKAIQYRAHSYFDRAQRALVRIELKDYEGAKKDIQTVKKEAPNSFLTHYADGRLAFQQTNYSQAQAAFEEALKFNTNDTSILYYLGVSHLNQQHNSQAEQPLSRFVRAVPNSVHGQKALALSRYRIGDLDSAKTILLSLIQHNQEDAFSTKLLGKVELSMGESQQGIKYLKDATLIQPESATAHINLGMALITQKEKQQGLLELEKASMLDPNLQQADILLITTYLKEKQYDKAIEAAKQLIAKQPNNSDPYTLMAGAYLAKGNQPKARELLNKALMLNPADSNAAIAQANMEISVKNFDKAESLFRQFLDSNPGHLRILLKLAELEQKRGNHDKATMWLNRAIEDNPRELKPRIILGEYYLRSGQALKSLATTTASQDEYPNSPVLLMLIGQAQMAAARSSNAANTFEKLIKVKSKSAQAHYLLAIAYAETGKGGKFKEALDKTLALDPNHYGAKYLKIRNLVLEGNHDAANILISNLEESVTDNPEIIDLRAWMALRFKDTEKAISIYKNALQRFPDENRWVNKLSTVYFTTRDYKANFTILDDWLSKHPNDFQILFTKANHHLILNQLDQAQAAFAKLHELAPNNALVLNNLAWVLRNKTPQKALDYAESAYRLLPKSTEVMDTLAMILLDQGNSERAVALLKDATKKTPDRLDFKYHLALALVHRGDKDQARKVLKKVIDQNKPFTEEKAAQKLYEEFIEY